MTKKVVLKLDCHDTKIRTKALKVAVRVSGVESAAVSADNRLTVIGDIDPVKLCAKLRGICYTELLSVGPAKEPKEKKAEILTEKKEAAEMKEDSQEKMEAGMPYFSSFSGVFVTPDKQKLSMQVPKSRGGEDSERSQLQVHQHSDATIDISDRENTMATGPKGRVLPKGELFRFSSLPWPATFTRFANFFGFRKPDKQNLSKPDPKSRGEEDSERLLLQVHQYSDPTIVESTSGTAPEGGVLSMEELVRLYKKGELVIEEQETPSNQRELKELNYDPIEVPPAFSHHFSILRELDLSYTEIKSLPKSISRLVALQKLFLRACKLLMMELPPEIGELTNLEVLDLEGTEILCLPKEIAKLVDLTCLKVSFYGYANQTVIPRRVLSNLSRLNELIIDVTSHGEWWDVEVQAIIDNLCSLKELRTLKLYMPTTELLEKLTLIFPSLANFSFTVGCHEEHFIFRLPQNVEEEFNNWEKLEKGLKFINGNHIPNEITKVLNYAHAFVLQRHWTAESLSDFGLENMNEVKFCLLMECNEFRTIIDSEHFYQGKDGSESKYFLDFDEAIVLESLEKLIICYMKNMVCFWKGPVGVGSMYNLKSLALHTCPNLTTLFTIDMLSNLIKLEELVIEDCPKIDSLVSLKRSDLKSGLFLPNLKKISLLELPELVSISSGLQIAPKLERTVIFHCPKLEKLSATEVSSTELTVIKGENDWWGEWYESDACPELEDHLARHFPLRRDRDLTAQLTEEEIAAYGQGKVGSFKRLGFQTHDKENLSVSDLKSRVEKDSEHLRSQVHQYSDATMSISDCERTSGISPEQGVLSVVELGDDVSHFFEEELLEEIRSEELEETPSNPRELEDLIGVPMEFPPILSHDDFSIFQVLDLSGTEIKSLPQSISRLVSLQKLVLRSCALLMMELPPEIGELTNLEVLDLEGTEILCLPKEIAKLVSLTCLKVSFYGYANQTVIPRKVLSNLSRLNELIVDGTPYGEWWDVEVEAIIADLRNLKELRTLKLYLPTAKILGDPLSIFPSLANFRFTVGCHEEHFISRLPQNVEEEFNNREKLEKGLKFINGNCIPNEITKVLKHANAFVLQRHWTAESLSDFGHENMNEVKFCLVMECNEFWTIIDSEQFYQGKDVSESENFQDFDGAIVLESLENLLFTT